MTRLTFLASRHFCCLGRGETKLWHRVSPLQFDCGEARSASDGARSSEFFAVRKNSRLIEVPPVPRGAAGFTRLHGMPAGEPLRDVWKLPCPRHGCQDLREVLHACPLAPPPLAEHTPLKPPTTNQQTRDPTTTRMGPRRDDEDAAGLDRWSSSRSRPTFSAARSSRMQASDVCVLRWMTAG